ncbi:MAG: hypothetical protein JO276_09115 [Sphingomonadaceae bacterium]|nr:hypothetical protein [Sphingomonadaceae bacterium]
MFAIWLLAMTALSSAEPSPPADLAVYAGKYPTEPVNGVSFLQHPRVRAAVEAAVPRRSVRAWLLDRRGQQTPVAVRGDRVISWGCELRNCNGRDWTLFIDRTGTLAQICYHVGETMRDRSRWFFTGRPSELRPDSSCPS